MPLRIIPRTDVENSFLRETGQDLVHEARVLDADELVNAARLAVFLVSGFAKAPALKKVLEDPGCDFPARLIQPSQGNLIWMVDQAAATLLRST